jgi:PKHD-type hydroxylase
MPEAGWMRTTPKLLESNTVVWRDLFSKAQLDALEKQCDALTLEPARLSSGKTDNIRSTGIAWLHRTPQTEDLYLRMEAVVLKLNMDLFHADLTGMLPFQFARYAADGGGYFDWHSDYGRRADAPEQEPRKITLSLQLSDGADYDGCDLEVRTGHPVDVAPRERGTLVAFWSNALHRVTPITRGVRKSLVMWAAGPEFR